MPYISALFCNESISKGDEGFLTQYRSSLVGNKRLFILAKSLNLEKLISGLKFEPHLNWRPPRFSNDQDLEKEVIEWDNEFRKSLKDEADETPEAKKVSVSKVTLFQMMEEKDWIRIRTLRPSEKCKTWAKISVSPQILTVLTRKIQAQNNLYTQHVLSL